MIFLKVLGLVQILKKPGCCVPIIKKFLDQSKKMIFNNLETINFFYVDKEPYPNHEKLFKNKAFHYPKSINYSKVKNSVFCHLHLVH